MVPGPGLGCLPEACRRVGPVQLPQTDVSYRLPSQEQVSELIHSEGERERKREREKTKMETGVGIYKRKQESEKKVCMNHAIDQQKKIEEKTTTVNGQSKIQEKKQEDTLLTKKKVKILFFS